MGLGTHGEDVNEWTTQNKLRIRHRPVLKLISRFFSDSVDGLLGDATYHLSVYVVDPLACSSVEFRDCTSRWGGKNE